MGCAFLKDVRTFLQDDNSANAEIIAGIRKLVEKMDTVSNTRVA
jgi:hypothetical protein